MKPKPLLIEISFLALLAFLLILGRADTAHADFNPSYSITIADTQPEANSDWVSDFNVPQGDVNFAAAVFFIPADWGVTAGDDIPIGAVVGQLMAQATLGLINGPCNSVLPVAFTMQNASTDPADTVSYLDTDPEGAGLEGGYTVPDYYEDKDNSGLKDGIERYPDFITRVLDDAPGDEVGNPLTPIRRSAGITIVGGVKVLLQFLIFEPGTFIDERIPDDAELGYPSVTLLQNVGDPGSDPIPSAITDFCTSLTSTNTSFATSKDNACTGADTPPICEAWGAEVLEEGGSDPDEGGVALFTNPQDGTYTFTLIAAGQRDADGDSYENSMDTCAFDANTGDPRVKGDGDFDEDGLDAACDPDDKTISSDEDLDGYLNRQDNCPLIANGEESDNQRDTDDDTIGDACDPDPDNADAQGELTFKTVTVDVAIGTGTGPGGPPGGPAGDGGDGGDGDGGGGSTTLIIIIVAVVAGVVVVGGGAFYFMRRRRA